MSFNLFNKPLVIGILVLFLGIAISPCIGVVSKEFDLLETIEVQNEKTVTCYVFDNTGNSESEVVLSSDDFNRFYSIFEELNHMITYYSFSDKTEVLKVEFVDLLDNMGLIPKDTSKDDVIRLINPNIMRRRPLFSLLSNGVSGGRGSAFFCNFATLGEGTQLPVIILPRLIPIFLTPIPRVIMRWNADVGVTSCGGLLSGKGFIAEGAQQGTALGFWGIGFSVFLPPVMQFGFIGYALFATATAEVIHPWPPNRAPVISEENPLDGAVDVSLSFSELSFRISDADGDRMNYSVSTSPDIGSGSGSNVGDGTYTVDVSGLNSNTEYSWYVVVSDGEDTTEETFSFHTAIEAPLVSEPIPLDGDNWVSVDLSELSFRLEDLQGDLMDYTVETVPDIGSGSGSSVGDGVYSVDVGGLDFTIEYTWYVNVSDGEYWTRRIFIFKTQPVMVFDPFDEGWLYRKKITIDHNMVDGDLVDFPVLVSVVDPDLRDKAQVDGDDILFMDGSGISNRLFHEFEKYDDSSGELVAWVNVSNLSNVVDTGLYIYYNNPSCCSQQFPVKVWDSSYCGVWHLSELSGIIYDSTFNYNDGTIHGGAQWVNGISGYALNFDGVDDYVGILDTSDFEFANQDLTFSAWVQIFDNADSYRVFISLADVSDQYGIPKITLAKYRGGGNDGRIYFEIETQTGHNLIFSDDDGNTLPKYEWIYLTGVVDCPDSFKFYINAEFQDSEDLISFDMSDAFSLKLNFGSTPYPGHGGAYGRHKGLIDEIHFSNTNRNAEWISTEYNNQNDPSSFLSFGPEESAP